ncbi:MAG: C69 family dipeptidase [Bacteroidales bacterium]|nr:C69 family dipeptidase [Bacteroidales bacterium]MDD3665081.1 C69 family dipeptidase [Bacteroidales bacterium]
MKNTFVAGMMALMLSFGIQGSKACTNYLITKGASTDGSTMISYAADAHVLYGELYHWPAATWPAGTMLDINEWDTGKFLGKIKQAAQTYNVVGNMNEYQLSIGETTYGGVEMLAEQPGAVIDYGSLIYLALQRSKSAREAIKTMAELVEEYGYYSSGESFSVADADEVWILELIGKGKTITVDMKLLKSYAADVRKALKKLDKKTYFTDADFMKALTEAAGEPFAKEHGAALIQTLQKGEKGAVWVARMIPDGMVSGHANQARITTFPLDNNKSSLSSKNLGDIFNKGITTVYAHDVISFARSRGLVKPEVKDEEFSFSDTYAPVTFGSARFSEIRVWSMFNKVNAGMAQYWDYVKGDIKHDERTGYANNRMPLWIEPSRKVSPRDMMDFMRDHLEGTELDMTKDLGAGPFGNPYRWRPLTFKVDGVEYLNERATATQQTGFSFISQMRSWLPREIGGIHWFGVDDAASTVYFPMYSSATKVPEMWARGFGSMMEFNPDAAFWIFSQVSNFAYTRYNVIHPEIRKMQEKLEPAYLEAVKEIDSKALTLHKTNPQAAVKILTDYSCKTGNDLAREWKTFYGYLFTRFMDGNIKTKVPGQMNPKVEQPGYGEEWNRRVVKETGDKLKVKGSAH